MSAYRISREWLEESVRAVENVVQCLRDGGEVSVAEIKRRVTKAEQAHVDWPSALHPPLDDLATRYETLYVAGDDASLDADYPNSTHLVEKSVETGAPFAR